MATDRQIAANRRNAQKSTGPRSASGKKRASKNSFRHGLSKPMSGLPFSRAIEVLARSIVGEGASASTLGLGRQAAEAMLALDQIRRMELGLIALVSAFGRLETPNTFASKRDEVAWVMQTFLGVTPKRPPKFAVDELAPMPKEEPERTIEAVRRGLPALLRLQRYEARAIAKRDHAVRAIALESVRIAQNEPNFDQFCQRLII